MNDLFPGFDSHWIDAPGGRIFARSAGSGTPVLLLHGFPQTHACWHRMAPRLAMRHRVVVMDLRGYGWSSAPRSADGALYSKREMGRDAIAVMEALGHVRFALVGHDRGARVGYRLALDHAGRLTRLALLDILPTVEVWRRIRAGAMPAAHWGFLSGPAPGPETEIGKGPAAYVEGLMAKWAGTGDLSPFDPRARASYRDSANDPTRVHAFCEDYRAGATLDLEADEADLAAGRTVDCPTLALWGRFYLTGAGADPLAVWRSTFAPDAAGREMPGGHFVPEEAPGPALEALLPFLADDPADPLD